MDAPLIYFRIAIYVLLCFSPTIGEDFLSDLDLRTVQCIVGGALSKSPNHVLGMGSVERLRLRQGTHLQQIRHIAEVGAKCMCV